MLHADFIQKIKSSVDEKKIVELTIDLCSQKTINPPGNESLCLPILERYFNQIGVDSIEKYEKVSGRANLVARIKGDREGKSIAIVGHTDVVPVANQNWDTDPFVPIIKDGCIVARGAIDNKGPFAATLEGIRAYLEIVGRDFFGEIVIIASADEEQGSENGVKYLFKEVGMNVDYALIPDGGDFARMVCGEMGILTLKFLSKGKAYHGSQPEKGVNAIVPLAYLATILDSYHWSLLKGEDAFDNTVLNMGLISGGSSINTVPDNAELMAMWRYPLGISVITIKEIVHELISKVHSKYLHTNISYEQIQKSTPFLGDHNSLFIQAIKKSAEELGFAVPRMQTIRAETVAKYIHQSCGADVIVNGPMNDSLKLMHAPNEYVEIKSLVNFSIYYANILYNLGCKND